jgi:hypothetical protein
MPTVIVQKEVVDPKAVGTAEKPKPKKKPSIFQKEPHKMTKGEKFARSVNVRLTNYTHSTQMAGFIAFATFVGFVGLLLSMSLNCPVERTEDSKTVYNTGIKDMQREFVNKIINPDNMDELKAAGVSRKATICMHRAGIYKLGSHGTFNSPQDPTTFNAANPLQIYPNGYVELEACQLPGDEGFKLDGWEVTWCPGKEKMFNDPSAPMCTLDDGDMKSFTTHVTYTITTEKTVCPSAASILGSGLAYISYIEMFATVLVGVILIKTGFAKPLNDRATLSGLLKSANSDTSKVEDAIDTLRHDVDDMQLAQNDLDDKQSQQIAKLEEQVALLLKKSGDQETE